MREPPDGYLAVARVLRPVGLRGEMASQIITDFPERFVRGGELFIGDPPRAVEIESARILGQNVSLRLSSVSTREEVDAMRGTWIMIREVDAAPLPAGEYFWHQLRGLEVETDLGQSLGTIREILETGSNHVYVVKNAEREILIPALKDVILSVSLDDRRMVVHLLPGLEPT